MGYNIGPKIGIDGEKEFRQQIKNINDTYKALEAETKAVARAFDAQGDEQGKLEAMSKQLNKQIEEQRKKQALLEDAVAKASAKYGENSLEATRLRGALYDTQGTISTLESELKDAKTQLEHLGEAMEDLESDEELAKKAMAQFQDQINILNAKYKTLESETKAVTKSFEAQGDEQGKLEAISKQLEKQIELQIQKQKTLEAAIQKASDEFGDESIEVTKLRGALYDTQGTIADLENQLQDTTRQLDRTEDGMDALTESTDSASNAAVNFGDIMGANLVADVVMDGLRELGSLVKDFAVGSIESAAEFKAASAQYEQAFGSMQQQATASLEAISDDTNIAATRLQGSFTKVYSFAKTAGADSAQALNISSRAMVAAADSAAYYDDSIENVTERIQAFLKGNYANDAALGISATETTRNAKANELYAKSFKELTESQKVDTLLAMVEAGNKASGAIGQAARESDGWENIMGELAEMFRLAQAEAGKPALKKLTPIIQNITKAGYELIEDIDWEAFGDTVEKIADGVIDAGPGVVKSIASVAAGIVAFKAAKRIGELESLAAGFFGVGTAATAAGTAVAASGAAASATPWGAIAAVIGLAVSAITTMVIEAQNSQSELEKVTDRLRENFQQAEEAYRSTKNEVEGAAGAAEHYVGRLRALEDAGLDTAVAHREYEMIVEKLNELIPDLNLQIDEQTGLISGNTAALLADVEAWKKKATEQALFDKYADQVEAYAKAEASLIDAKARRKILEDNLLALRGKLGPLEDAEAAAKTRLTQVTYKLNNAEYKNQAELVKLTEEQLELESTIQRLSDQYGEFTTQIGDTEYEIKELNGDIADLDVELLKSNDSLETARNAMDFYRQSTAEAVQNELQLPDAQLAVKTSLENLGAAYREAEEAARKSIDSQIGLFDELSASSEWSADKIMKNWESQQLAFSKYADNLAKAVDLKLNDTLVQQLSDGSVESMQILDKLVNDAEIDIDAINAAFAKTDQARDTMASAMAAVQTDTKTKFDAIVADAEQAGLDIAEGAGKGVKNNSWRFTNEIASMAKIGQDLWNQLWDRHSPSRWMGDASADIVEGGALNIERYSGRFADAMADLAMYGQNAFLQKKLDIAVSYPDMVASSTIHNNSPVTHMGGFVINITQQPGESAENIAYRCMELIQEAVDSKGAVFGAG